MSVGAALWGKISNLGGHICLQLLKDNGTKPQCVTWNLTHRWLNPTANKESETECLDFDYT